MISAIIKAFKAIVTIFYHCMSIGDLYIPNTSKMSDISGDPVSSYYNTAGAENSMNSANHTAQQQIFDFYWGLDPYLHMVKPATQFLRTITAGCADFMYGVDTFLQTFYVKMFALMDIRSTYSPSSTFWNILHWGEGLGIAACILATIIYFGMMILAPQTENFEKIKILIRNIIIGAAVIGILPTVFNGFTTGLEYEANYLIGNNTMGGSGKTMGSITDDMFRYNVVSVPNKIASLGLNPDGTPISSSKGSSKTDSNANNAQYVIQVPESGNRIRYRPRSTFYAPNVNQGGAAGTSVGNKEIYAHQVVINLSAMDNQEANSWNGLWNTSIPSFLHEYGSDDSLLNPTNDNSKRDKAIKGGTDKFNLQQMQGAKDPKYRAKLISKCENQGHWGVLTDMKCHTKYPKSEFGAWTDNESNDITEGEEKDQANARADLKKGEIGSAEGNQVKGYYDMMKNGLTHSTDTIAPLNVNTMISNLSALSTVDAHASSINQTKDGNKAVNGKTTTKTPKQTKKQKAQIGKGNKQQKNAKAKSNDSEDNGNLGVFGYELDGTDDFASISKISEGTFKKMTVGSSTMSFYDKYKVQWFNIFTGLLLLAWVLIAFICKLVAAFFKVSVMYATIGIFIYKSVSAPQAWKVFIRSFFGIYEMLMIDVLVIRLWFVIYFIINNAADYIAFHEVGADANGAVAGLVAFVCDFVISLVAIHGVNSIDKLMGPGANAGASRSWGNAFATVAALRGAGSAARLAGAPLRAGGSLLHAGGKGVNGLHRLGAKHRAKSGLMGGASKASNKGNGHKGLSPLKRALARHRKNKKPTSHFADSANSAKNKAKLNNSSKHSKGKGRLNKGKNANKPNSKKNNQNTKSNKANGKKKNNSKRNNGKGRLNKGKNSSNATRKNGKNNRHNNGNNGNHKPTNPNNHKPHTPNGGGSSSTAPSDNSNDSGSSDSQLDNSSDSDLDNSNGSSDSLDSDTGSNDDNAITSDNDSDTTANDSDSDNSSDNGKGNQDNNNRDATDDYNNAFGGLSDDAKSSNDSQSNTGKANKQNTQNRKPNSKYQANPNKSAKLNHKLNNNNTNPTPESRKSPTTAIGNGLQHLGNGMQRLGGGHPTPVDHSNDINTDGTVGKWQPSNGVDGNGHINDDNSTDTTGAQPTGNDAFTDSNSDNPTAESAFGFTGNSSDSSNSGFTNATDATSPTSPTNNPTGNGRNISEDSSDDSSNDGNEETATDDEGATTGSQPISKQNSDSKNAPDTRRTTANLAKTANKQRQQGQPNRKVNNNTTTTAHNNTKPASTSHSDTTTKAGNSSQHVGNSMSKLNGNNIQPTNSNDINADRNTDKLQPKNGADGNGNLTNDNDDTGNITGSQPTVGNGNLNATATTPNVDTGKSNNTHSTVNANQSVNTNSSSTTPSNSTTITGNGQNGTHTIDRNINRNVTNTNHIKSGGNNSTNTGTTGSNRTIVRNHINNHVVGHNITDNATTGSTNQSTNTPNNTTTTTTDTNTTHSSTNSNNGTGSNPTVINNATGGNNTGNTQTINRNITTQHLANIANNQGNTGSTTGNNGRTTTRDVNLNNNVSHINQVNGNNLSNSAPSGNNGVNHVVTNQHVNTTNHISNDVSGSNIGTNPVNQGSNPSPTVNTIHTTRTNHINVENNNPTSINNGTNPVSQDSNPTQTIHTNNTTTTTNHINDDTDTNDSGSSLRDTFNQAINNSNSIDNVNTGTTHNLNNNDSNITNDNEATDNSNSSSNGGGITDGLFRSIGGGENTGSNVVKGSKEDQKLSDLTKDNGNHPDFASMFHHEKENDNGNPSHFTK